MALNRAAMTSPELAELLLRSGRHRVGPLVERYLHQEHIAGQVHAPDAAAAFRLFYGLVVQDTQIRVLLGEQPPTGQDIAHHADMAVKRFLQLTRPLGDIAQATRRLTMVYGPLHGHEAPPGQPAFW